MTKDHVWRVTYDYKTFQPAGHLGGTAHGVILVLEADEIGFLTPACIAQLPQNCRLTKITNVELVGVIRNPAKP